MAQGNYKLKTHDLALFLKIINERHMPGSKHYIEHAATYTVYFESSSNFSAS